MPMIRLEGKKAIRKARNPWRVYEPILLKRRG